MTHDFDYSVLDRLAHRPWPIPERPWVMTQTWRNLLFAHWPIAPQILRPLIPSSFELDCFEGSAWIGIVPFQMTNVAPLGAPAMPLISDFDELNVRTYVKVANRAGIYFFSLDASSRLAVNAARVLLNLPYFAATMKVVESGGLVAYESRRRSAAVRVFRAGYRASGRAFTAARGTLDYFLTERYCLYNLDRKGRPYYLDIHHPPWLLRNGEADIEQNSMAAAARIDLPDFAPLLHFVNRQDMVAWAPQLVNSRCSSP